MKNTIAILIMLLSLPGIAQDTFIIKRDIYKYDKPRDITIKPNGNLIFLFTSKPSGSDVFTNYVYEISSSGEVVDSVSYSDTSNKLVEFEHCYFLNDTLYLFGSGSKFGTSQETFLFMLKFDAQLNLLENFKYSPGLVGFGGSYSGKLKLINNQFHYISAALSNSTDVPFCATISKQGQLLNFGVDLNYPGSIFCPFDFVNHTGDNGYKVFEGTHGFQGVPEICGLISYFSKDFQREDFSILPYDMYAFFTYQGINDSVYYLAGEWWEGGIDPKRAGILKLMNDTTVVDKFLYDTQPDSTACTAYRHSLEILPDGNLIFCFTDNIDLEKFPSLFPTKINLMKLTPDFDVIWHRYIGDGIDSWQAWVMNINDAEEIIIHGTHNIADISHYQNRDVLFIKTTSEGIITGTNEDFPGIESTQAIVYPNPAADFVQIEFSMAYTQATFSLLDISGKTVFVKQLATNKQSLDISGIPAGTYIYRIYNQKGLDESGKLMVE